MIERNYISENGVAETDRINELVSCNIKNGNMVLMYTHKFECAPQGDITDISHLLEARIFTKEKELKIMRPTIADEFRYRIIDDSKMKSDYIEERQYLDIDETKTKGFHYTATGGGKYKLTVENAEKIVIRNYISYDEQGIAQITDFRLVEYLCKEVE